jgi:hypothetical protein
MKILGMKHTLNLWRYTLNCISGALSLGLLRCYFLNSYKEMLLGLSGMKCLLVVDAGKDRFQDELM